MKDSLTKEIIYNDVKEVIQGLSESLQVGAEHVYEIMVIQQYVHSVTYTLILFVSYPLYKLTVFSYKRMVTGEQKGKDAPFVAFIFVAFADIIYSLWMLLELKNTLTGFFNPEFGAIKQIMDLI
jgi:hypothetical protein